VIAVGICARKILIAREAKFVVSMAAKRTVLTLGCLLVRKNMKSHFFSLPWVVLFQHARKMVSSKRRNAMHLLVTVGVLTVMV